MAREQRNPRLALAVSIETFIEDEKKLIQEVTGLDLDKLFPR